MIRSTEFEDSSLKVQSFSIIEAKAWSDRRFKSSRTAGSTNTTIRFSCEKKWIKARKTKCRDKNYPNQPSNKIQERRNNWSVSNFLDDQDRQWRFIPYESLSRSILNSPVIVDDRHFKFHVWQVESANVLWSQRNIWQRDHVLFLV